MPSFTTARMARYYVWHWRNWDTYSHQHLYIVTTAQQYRLQTTQSKTTVSCYGKELLLDGGSSRTRKFQCYVAPRPRKLGRLLHKTLRRMAPSTRPPILLAHAHFTVTPTASIGSAHSERVCWISPQRLYQEHFIAPTTDRHTSHVPKTYIHG